MAKKTNQVKGIVFEGSSKEDLRDLPRDVVVDAGYQLYRVQCGEDPDDWKPMTTVGSGAMELRVWAEDGTYRVIYVAKFHDAVHVLHVFKKTTKATSRADIALARKRYKEIA